MPLMRYEAQRGRSGIGVPPRVLSAPARGGKGREGAGRGGLIRTTTPRVAAAGPGREAGPRLCRWCGEANSVDMNVDCSPWRKSLFP